MASHRARENRDWTFAVFASARVRHFEKETTTTAVCFAGRNRIPRNRSEATENLTLITLNQRESVRLTVVVAVECRTHRSTRSSIEQSPFLRCAFMHNT
jgi:hypothetical protein